MDIVRQLLLQLVLLSTIQIGITLAGFLGSAFAADNFAQRLSEAICRDFGIAQQ